METCLNNKRIQLAISHLHGLGWEVFQVRLSRRNVREHQQYRPYNILLVRIQALDR